MGWVEPTFYVLLITVLSAQNKQNRLLIGQRCYVPSKFGTYYLSQYLVLDKIKILGELLSEKFGS